MLPRKYCGKETAGQMFTWALKKILGTSHERELKKLRPKVDAINGLEPRISSLSDAELKAKSAEFREKLDNGATVDDLLIEAFEMLKPDDARLNIIGAPPPHYKEQFEALLHRCSQTCDVRFLGYQSDVLRHLRSAYLYVHPSPPTRFHESYGRGVVEAMSLGVPSVCFRSGSLQEIVVNGQTGIVCEEETPQCLAEAIRRFLGDPMFRENCGKDARIRYETVYSQLKVRPAWVEFFGRDMDHGA